MSFDLIETTSESKFIRTTVKFLKQKIEFAVSQKNSCIIGFSGGSTPRPIYEALAKEKMDWSKISGFLVDERYVPPEHPQSNQHLIRETIPDMPLSAPNTSFPLPQCVRQYAQDLRKLWSDHLPDIIVLGMGADGHTASLFPPLAKNIRDDTRLVAHTRSDIFDIPDRITLTLNPILAAESHVILIKGKDKKETWDAMIKSSEHESRWPIKVVLEQSDVTVVAYWY